MDSQTKEEFEKTLTMMGINPSNIGKNGGTLPPIPSSSSEDIQRNKYDGFYKYGAREFWDQAEVTQNQIEDFKKCQHYLMRKNNEIYCVRCHSGWLDYGAVQVIDGKLFKGETQLQFAP